MKNNNNLHNEVAQNVPPDMENILISHGVENIIAHSISDLTNDGIRCNAHIFATKDKLHIICGSTATQFEKDSPKKLLNKLKNEFAEIAYYSFDYAGIKSFSVSEMVASAVLLINRDDGSTEVAASSTCGEKSSLFTICDELNKIIGYTDGNGNTEDEENIHSDAHHNDATKTEDTLRHKQAEDPSRCPKCGKKYTDPRRKICMNCLDKGKIIKRLLPFCLRYKKALYTSIAVLIVTSALSVLVPYVSSGFFYDKVLLDNTSEFFGKILQVIFIIIGTRLLSLLVSIISGLINARLAANINYDLKDVIFSSIERLSLDFFSNRQTGSLLTQVTSDSSKIFWFFLDGIPFFLINIVQMAAVIGIMLFMSPLLTVIYLTTVPIIIFLVRKFMSEISTLTRKAWHDKSDLNSLISDTLNGIRVVKSFSREKDGSERFEEINKKTAFSFRTAKLYGVCRFPIIEILLGVADALILGIGGYMVSKGSLTYGTLMTFISYSVMVTSPLSRFVNMTNEAADGLTAMNRLVEIMDASPTVIEAENPSDKIDLSGDLVFDNVSFGYVKNRNVLKDISFNVPSGTVLGIVGHTGAGKSTIANLITRMYDVGKGEIRIDNVPIKELSIQTLRKNIAIVSQETYLFVGTILDNIKYANPSADEDEVIRAAKISGAHDFIIKLPDAYYTRIGFGGRQLSGGERQRVSIARALLMNPNILILDEATAAMDTQTERKIQNALDILIKGKTTIMIAHRLSTLRNADKLIVVKDGEICESGTPDELIRNKGEYFKLYQLQLEALKSIGVNE